MTITMMTSDEIRKRYLEFFEKRGHAVVPSDLLVPREDPTLLFTGAGMNQFKDQFMGKNITFSRAVSCQKCLRTGDLENVGKTPRHHTFFEMLGNFSFGDYFKKEAIQWAWEFMTKEMGLPEGKLWVSIYEEDDEAYSIWLDEVKVSAEKIVKLGAHDNFWPADAPTKGPNGPCGPCSEIFYDWGEGTGCGKETCNPACECGRFVEVWNLVFTQFERKSDGSLDPLPSKNIDTGMGLERMASVMQGVKTNFDIDIFTPITELIKKELGKNVSASDANLIADHVRAVTFAIADGVSPSNEERGYVVRKLIRRAYLKGSAKEKPFLFNIVPTIAKIFKDVYPELEEKREHISAIVEEEEKRFIDTLKTAMPVLKDMLSRKPKVLEGEKIFKLVDTYGLPLEIIAAQAEAAGTAPDVEGFEKFMEGRKEESRKGSVIAGEFIFQPDLFREAPKPDYSDELPLEAELEFILEKEKSVDKVSEGARAEVITSPQSGKFYAEAGGQVGDTGHITKEGGEMKVLNTFEVDGRKVLEVFVKKGSFSKKEKVKLFLDAGKKQKTALNHTATHLLQAALRQVLGEHVKQSGSLVDEKHLRFDFTHMKKLTDRELRKVEELINSWIKEGISVCKEVKSIKKAKEEGALSFFGEKYGETVRVVSIGGYSKELCGGTHVDNISEIELVKIKNETSVASGIRRIEAVAGENARAWLKKTLQELLAGEEALRKRLEKADELKKEVPELEEVLKEARDIIEGRTEINEKTAESFEVKLKPVFLKAREYAEKMIKKQKKSEEAGTFDRLKDKVDEILRSFELAGRINLMSGLLGEADMNMLRKAAGYAEKKIDSGVVVIGASRDDKAYLVCVVTPDLEKKGVSAKDIIGRISDAISGGGGGKATFAQAGGQNPGGLKDALDKCKKIIGEMKI
jgi:alanyl-tRNA synthetase